MKLLVTLMIVGSALLIAGGDILPVKVMTKFEKEDVTVHTGCYKPHIQKCPDCVDVAEICPDNPSLPITESEPCPGLQNNH